MATEKERAEFRRIISNSVPPVRIVEFPKLADALGPLLPRAIEALRDFDAKVEEWRKGILFAESGGGTTIVQTGSGTTPTILDNLGAQGTVLTSQGPGNGAQWLALEQIFFDKAPAVPEQPSRPAVSVNSTTGAISSWNPTTQSWIAAP